ncbi:MAG: FUSC family protein [Nocardioidaceae bacterium]
MRDDSGIERSLDGLWDKGRLSTRARVARLRAKSWHVAQCSIAAGVAWFLATTVIGHPRPFFAPVVAVVCLGTSYGQRLRRVAEVTVGVAVGVFMADALVLLIGSGAWQLTIIVALAMSTAFLVTSGQLLVTQAAVQSIVVVTLAAAPGYALTRWIDALVGGGVALVAAAVVPRAPLRRPREQAAVVVRRISQLLRAAAETASDGDADRAVEVLASARRTEPLIRELQAAADEGLSVIASSPFRRRHTGDVRRMAELVEPLDRALRNTRVLVRRVAVAIYHREPLPHSYALLCEDLASAADGLARQLARGEMAMDARGDLLAIGRGTAEVERTADLSADVVLAQLRSIIVDLLQLTGLGVLEATDALPPPRR